MAAIRKRGNRSTEWKFRSALVRAGITGWVMHEKTVPGCPDFWFAKSRIAIFVDGCFWHGCHHCNIPMPKANRSYWVRKLAMNKSRAQTIATLLKANAIRVIRIWEHELAVYEKVAKLLNHIRSLNTNIKN